MSVTAEALRKLAELRLDPDQMAGVLSLLADISAAEEGRKTAQRERTRRHRDAKRDCNVTVTDVKRYSDVTAPSSPPKRKVSPCTPSKENNPPSNPEQTLTGLSAAPKNRGSRVDGFQPDIAEAVGMGISADRARQQSERFVDFWKGKPGAGGVKLDWPATWRNWIRSEIERNGTGGGSRAGPNRIAPANQQPLRQADRLYQAFMGTDDEPEQADQRVFDGEFTRRSGAH